MFGPNKLLDRQTVDISVILDALMIQWRTDGYHGWVNTLITLRNSNLCIAQTDSDCYPSMRTSSFTYVFHYDDVIMGAMASQITNLTIVYSTVYSGADQRKHQSSALLVFVCGIHWEPVNSPHKWPVTRKMFPFDDVTILRWLSWRLFGTNPLSEPVFGTIGNNL